MPESKPENLSNRKPLRSSPISVVIIGAYALLAAVMVRQHFLIQNLQFSNNQVAEHAYKTTLLNHKMLNRQHEDAGNRNQPPHISVARMTEAVCLIQGEYYFADPKTDQPLRYLDTAPLGASDDDQVPQYPIGLAEKGPLLLVHYTGTGFLIDKSGRVITNKHVTEPWKTDHTHKHLIDAGYVPKLKIFRAFFPGHDQPFELEKINCSPDEDLAVLQCKLDDADIKPLNCDYDTQSLQVGHTVMILGYPTGFDLLLARMNDEQLLTLGANYDEIACSLACKNLIAPMATRGMCGRITDGKIVYDAQTAAGASGAPVIDSRGRVVAVNTALLKGFPGTNFGIPAASIKKLLN